MLTEERYNHILKLIEEKGAITVTELTKELGISESTIRRDLNALDRLGHLKKVHGGATALTEDFFTKEEDVHTKEELMREEKDRIARFAASLITPDDFVYIDAGTTTERMIDYLTETKPVYVTDGIDHAKKLAARGFRVYILAGELKLSTGAITGSDAVASLQKYNFTKAFMGTNGISIEGGYTTPEMNEANVKMEAMKRAFVSYVLADHTKFSQTTSVTFSPLERAVILTDQEPDIKYKNCTIIKLV